MPRIYLKSLTELGRTRDHTIRNSRYSSNQLAVWGSLDESENACQIDYLSLSLQKEKVQAASEQIDQTLFRQKSRTLAGRYALASSEKRTLLLDSCSTVQGKAYPYMSFEHAFLPHRPRRCPFRNNSYGMQSIDDDKHLKLLSSRSDLDHPLQGISVNTKKLAPVPHKSHSILKLLESLTAQPATTTTATASSRVCESLLRIQSRSITKSHRVQLLSGIGMSASHTACV